MNLENSYRITLTTNKGAPFVQYIESDNVDNAIRAARKTFHAHLHSLLNCSEAQKACDKTILQGRLRFGFTGGWNTIDCTGMTIFQAMEKAKHCFGGIQDVTEIYSE